MKNQFSPKNDLKSDYSPLILAQSLVSKGRVSSSNIAQQLYNSKNLAEKKKIVAVKKIKNLDLRNQDFYSEEEQENKDENDKDDDSLIVNKSGRKIVNDKIGSEDEHSQEMKNYEKKISMKDKQNLIGLLEQSNSDFLNEKK